MRRDTIHRRWMRHVANAEMSRGCKSLLMILASEMDDDGYVSVVQTDLAATLDAIGHDGPDEHQHRSATYARSG